MENKPFFKSPSRADIKRPTLVAASGLVLLAALGLWITSLAAIFLPGEDPMHLMTWVNIIYYLPFVLIPAIIYAAKKKGLSDGLRLNPVPVFPLFSVILLAVISTLFSSVLTTLWGSLLDLIGLDLSGVTVVPETKEELMLSVIIVAAVPAVCEELLFRGYVLSAWEGRGTKYAILVSSVLFALMHGNIYGLPAYLFVGIIAGYLVFSLDSVYVGMIFHTVYNTACLVINYLSVSEITAEETAQAAAAIDTAGLVISMVLELFMGAVMIIMTLFTLKMRRKIMGIEPLPRTKQPLNRLELTVLTLSVIPMIAMIILS